MSGTMEFPRRVEASDLRRFPDESWVFMLTGWTASSAEPRILQSFEARG
jgi:hypothetical protein